MEEYLRERLGARERRAGEVLGTVGYVLDSITKKNYHVAVAYLILLSEQTIEVREGETEELRGRITALTLRIKEITESCYHPMIDGIQWTNLSVESREEEGGECIIKQMIGSVIETLLRTSTAEIESAIEAVQEVRDPRTTLGEEREVESGVIEEIFYNLSRLTDKEDVKTCLKMTVRLLNEDHVSSTLRYLCTLTKTSKLLPKIAFLINRPFYDMLEREISKDILNYNHTVIESLPKMDIEIIIKSLYRNTKVLSVVETLLRTRPIYRERLLREIPLYLSLGNRDKCILFIRENLQYFKIENLELSCEEVLLLAEKDRELLQLAFKELSKLREEAQSEAAEKQRKRPDLAAKGKAKNYPTKKEKRFSLLTPLFINKLVTLTEEELVILFRSLITEDRSLFCKVFQGLSKIRHPGEDVKAFCEEVIQGVELGLEKDSPELVFTVLPYLALKTKTSLIPAYLTDDLSLTLFLRVLDPEDILYNVHHIKDVETSISVSKLCLLRTEAFTDQVISQTVLKLEKDPSLSPILIRTLIQSLSTFPNLKPFIVSLLYRASQRFRFDQNLFVGLCKLLERLGAASPEILLSLEPAYTLEIERASDKLRKTLMEYLCKQPLYIQNKYKKYTFASAGEQEG